MWTEWPHPNQDLFERSPTTPCKCTQVPETKQCVKYLGVWVDEGLTGVDHVQAVWRKCLGGQAKLRRLRDTLPAALKKNMYNALVWPHLDCCCVLWQECGIQLQKGVERIQNYAMRPTFSKPPTTLSEELRSDMNWMPLSKRRELFRLALVHRCVHGCAPAYLAECYWDQKTVWTFYYMGSQ